MKWRTYPKPNSVAQRRAKAAKARESLSKQGKKLEPVVIEGRAIATTFWGKAWCKNLESYQDYASRLPRGRSYVRSGSVLDLKITPGAIDALVQGTSRYRVKIVINAMPRKRWEAFKHGTQGRISSAIALLNGELPENVLEQIIAPKTGLFPMPAEISLSCSCPDWAVMCKHVAAALYGVGQRLDAQPELLFRLRNVDPDELISHVISTQSITGGTVGGRATSASDESQPVIADDLLGELFGIDLSDTGSRKVRKIGAQKVTLRKKAAGKKAAGKKATGKKATGKKAAGKKAAGKKAAGKKAINNKTTK